MQESNCHWISWFSFRLVPLITTAESVHTDQLWLYLCEQFSHGQTAIQFDIVPQCQHPEIVSVLPATVGGRGPPLTFLAKIILALGILVAAFRQAGNRTRDIV